uniref:Putative Zinc finger family protein isoform 1 n=1 Tax=Davidia involucrata TaxID=16924 RepID=A0A5B6ZYQ0_DAVIN
MPTSRFLSLFGASIFRCNKNLSPIRFTKLFPSPNLRFHRYISSSSAAASLVDTISTDSSGSGTASDSLHPWPEWVTFVDRLKTKGYFVQTPNDEDGDVGDTRSSDAVVYKDMNLLKDASLSFARDRFDIFKSLSKHDVQAVVEIGCPNLFRKAVSSAKRLRAHVQLDEGDVCSACNLRGSCDRAYVIPKESEGAARTVDIVRILLFYALDPLVISGGVKPPGRELVEISARNLLVDLIRLSETSLDPALPKPAGKASNKKEQSQEFMDDKFSQDVEMKRGDWMCLKCNFMNFARNVRCLKCNEDGPKRVDADVEMKKGDWVCPECNFMNFARNIRCLKCRVEGPKRIDVDDVEMKKGDWNCSQCGFMNFASNTKCLRCRGPRPKRQLNPGEWECPKCDFLNYRKNKVCLKCNCERPKEAGSQYEEQKWRRPS